MISLTLPFFPLAHCPNRVCPETAPLPIEVQTSQQLNYHHKPVISSTFALINGVGNIADSGAWNAPFRSRRDPLPFLPTMPYSRGSSPSVSSKRRRHLEANGLGHTIRSIDTVSFRGTSSPRSQVAGVTCLSPISDTDYAVRFRRSLPVPTSPSASFLLLPAGIAVIGHLPYSFSSLSLQTYVGLTLDGHHWRIAL